MSLFSVFARPASGQLPDLHNQAASGVGKEQAAAQPDHDQSALDADRPFTGECAAPEPSSPLDAGLALPSAKRMGFAASVRRFFAAADPAAAARQQGITELAVAHAAVVDPNLAPLLRCAALTNFLGKAEGNTARVRALVLPERPELAPLALAARTLLEVPTVNNAQGFQMLADLLVPAMLRAMDGLRDTELRRQLRPALTETATALATAHAHCVSHTDSLPHDFVGALAADGRLCLLLAAGSEAHHAVYGHGYPELFRLHSRDPIGDAVELARDIIAPTGLGSLAETANSAEFAALADALTALEAETALLALSHAAGLELPGGAGPGRRSLPTLLFEVHAASAPTLQNGVSDMDGRLRALHDVAQLLLQEQGGAAAHLRLLNRLRLRFARPNGL
jgi:hypothetical protein